MPSHSMLKSRHSGHSSEEWQIFLSFYIGLWNCVLKRIGLQLGFRTDPISTVLMFPPLKNTKNWKNKKQKREQSYDYPLFALQDGLEPTTPWLTVRCSNQLSYWSSITISFKRMQKYDVFFYLPNISEKKYQLFIIKHLRRVNQQVQNYKTCLKNSHFGVEKFNFSLGLSFNFFCMDIILLSV